jgi:hypothetical protein
MENQNQSRNPIAGLVAVVDVILIFAMGILGNKISEIFNISTNLLLILTAFGLLSLATISYFSSKGITHRSSIEKPSGFSLKQFAPKTMIGIFPFGAFLGMLIGLILPASYVEETNPSYIIPSWIAYIFGRTTMFLTSFEFLGVLLGLVLCIVFAITIDAYLAASIALGYGIAFATAVMFRQPFNNIFLTYVGEGAFWILVGGALVIISAPLKKLRTVLSTPRL